MHKAVILVGGPSRGTRFRPLSLTVPKPLFPIAGLPIVYHHVQALAKVPDMKEILLIGFFEPSEFAQFLQQVTNDFPSINIRYLREFQSLGTGGGLYHFRDQILRGSPELIFVLHADVCSAFPLQSMVQFHKQKGATAAGTILGTKVPKELSHKYGCIVAESESDKVLHYVEKPETFVSDLISCGVYVFSPVIFKLMEKTLDSAASISTGVDHSEHLSLEQDILRPLAQSGQLFVYQTNEFWRQIKSAGSALPSNKLYLYQYRHCSPSKLVPQKKESSGEGGPTIIGDVFIHPSAHVDPSAKIGPNVSIGPKCTIGRGVCIKESIILDNVEIGASSCILYSIVGWNCKIGQWVRIEGTPQYASENVSPAANISDLGANVSTSPMTDLMLPNGVKNQSVTILGDSVSVANEQIIRNCIVLPHKDLNSSYKNEILM
ncbi:hypothetical protein MIR68_001471 [Amoeboaphelidium protococcarum]|nr:hypothetical protein MIR68_001471 [Amoeboaphelidium protococcarum]